MAPQSMHSNGIYADYEKMAADEGISSQSAAVQRRPTESGVLIDLL